jgi:hypothetical protein
LFYRLRRVVVRSSFLTSSWLLNKMLIKILGGFEQVMRLFC